MNEIDSMELSLANASYHLAKEIFGEINRRGFYSGNTEDMHQLWILRELTGLLQSLGDRRYTEFVHADDLVILSPDENIIEFPLWRVGVRR